MGNAADQDPGLRKFLVLGVAIIGLVAGLVVLRSLTKADPDQAADREAREAFAHRNAPTAAAPVPTGTIDDAGMRQFYWQISGPIIDARPAGKRREGRIPRSLDGRADPARQIAALPPAKSTRIVVYGEDAADPAPAEVQRHLAAAGYGHCLVYTGGIAAWAALNGPIERSAP